MNLDWLFNGYLRCMAALGRFAGRHGAKSHGERLADAGTNVDLSGLSYEAADEMAVKYGNRYRSLGIAIGLLGIAIVFLAIAPTGFSLEGQLVQVVAVAKVVLMVAMLLIVWFGERSRINRSWIALRLHAEALRYAKLRDALQAFRDTRSPAHDAALRAELVRVLDGDEGQIAYNAGKKAQYEAIERFSDVLLWFSLGLAIFGAVGHLFLHWSWAIFLTAFLPAMVGGIHGINGFLSVGGLAWAHERTHEKLLEVRDELDHADDPQGQALLDVGSEALTILTSRDARWKVAAEKGKLKPA